jgi:hypothetical protein
MVLVKRPLRVLVIGDCLSCFSTPQPLSLRRRETGIRAFFVIVHFAFLFGPIRERANFILSLPARLRTDAAPRLSNIPMAAALSPAAALDRSWPSSSGAHGLALYGSPVISPSPLAREHTGNVMHRQNSQSTKKSDGYAQEQTVILQHYFLAFSPISTSRRAAFYSFAPGGIAPVAGAGSDGGVVSAAGAAPLSSAAFVQSPAQSLVPLTVPTSLQPIGACGLARTGGLLPTLGGGR